MLKNLAIRTITPLSWRWSRRRLASSLHRFSLVEADSAWQMLDALDAVEDPVFRVKLFNNALEEVRHAELFGKLAASYSSLPLPLAGPPRKPLFNPKRGLAHFEAHHFIGEADVYAQFLAYAKSASSGPLRETFLAIRGDEEHHRELAYAELRQLVGSERETRKLILRIRLVRLYEAWLRLGKNMARVWSATLLSLLYLVSGPVLGPLCRKRLTQNMDARF